MNIQPKSTNLVRERNRVTTGSTPPAGRRARSWFHKPVAGRSSAASSRAELARRYALFTRASRWLVRSGRKDLR